MVNKEVGDVVGWLLYLFPLLVLITNSVYTFPKDSLVGQHPNTFTIIFFWSQLNGYLHLG